MKAAARSLASVDRRHQSVCRQRHLQHIKCTTAEGESCMRRVWLREEVLLLHSTRSDVEWMWREREGELLLLLRVSLALLLSCSLALTRFPVIAAARLPPS